MVFLADFKKEIDLVNLKSIIKGLLNLGVQPAIIRWTKAFFTNYEQCARIANSVSPKRKKQMVPSNIWYKAGSVNVCCSH